jgi:uncharacterized protein (DUF885 family)
MDHARAVPISRRKTITLLCAAAAMHNASAAESPAQVETKARAAAPGAADNKDVDGLFADAANFLITSLPEQATSLGLDTGPHAALRSRLTDRSHAGRAAFVDTAAHLLARARRINPADAPGLKRPALLSLRYALEGEVATRRFPTWDEISGQISPYALSQLTGAYQQVPDFLDSQHPVLTPKDAEAYLARLADFARVIDQDTERLRTDAGRGVLAPDFALDKSMKQLMALRDQPADQSDLAASLDRRAQEKNISGDWKAAAERIVTKDVHPALDRQIAAVAALRPRATHDAGVWRLPDGPAFYVEALRQNITTTLTATEIHKLGRDLQEKLTAEIDRSLKAQGLTQGTVGARLRALYENPKFRYPDTDAGKGLLLSDVEKKIATIRERLPRAFRTLPKAAMEVKRVPPYLEAGAPLGSAVFPSIDGSRAGIFYINLGSTAESPSWTLPTLTFHEGIPGHYVQGTIANESADLPLVQKVLNSDVNLSGFNSYVEGWALYAEQLADELGMYEDDPFGRIGYLHDAAFRAVRLVVDTGVHSLHWSRERAVRYFIDAIGDKEETAAREVERYSVWPGQACGYMIGKITWLRLRQRAKIKLGPRFDLRDFHDAALLAGPMPLAVLEGEIDRYIAKVR